MGIDALALKRSEGFIIIKNLGLNDWMNLSTFISFINNQSSTAKGVINAEFFFIIESIDNYESNKELFFFKL